MSLFFMLYPSLIMMIYCIYIIVGGQEKMEGVVIAALITGGVSLFIFVINSFRSIAKDKKNYTELSRLVSERHTSSDAEKYHNDMVNKLEYEHYILDDTKHKVEKVSDSLIGVDSTISKISHDFSQYYMSIKTADSSKIGLQQSLSTIEKVVQMNGMLISKNKELEINNAELKKQNTELLKTNENLRAKLQQLNHKINRSKDDLDLDR